MRPATRASARRSADGARTCATSRASRSHGSRAHAARGRAPTACRATTTARNIWAWRPAARGRSCGSSARRAWCPPLREAFANGHLSWVQAYLLMPLLLELGAGRFREAWVAHAQRITVRRLGDDVERALALGESAPPRLKPGAQPDGSDLLSAVDPAGLQTGASTRLEKESERL